MKKINDIRTKRLIISIAKEDEMRLLIESEKEEELKKAYTEMYESSKLHPEDFEWYAVWLIKLKSGERIGDLCFKGLNDDGSVEIGYGLLEEYWGKGYATEAVKAMTEWASFRNGVKRIEAETEENNTASRRVLEKSGFVYAGTYGEEGPRFFWKGIEK